MSRQGMLITTIEIEAIKSLTLPEICAICQVDSDFIEQLAEYNIVDPLLDEEGNWRFNESHLKRVQMVLRLQQDLELNLAGAALVIDLLDEIEKLRARVEVLDKFNSLVNKS